MGTEGSKYESIKENEESKTSSPDDNGDENSGGPINQVTNNIQCGKFIFFNFKTECLEFWLALSRGYFG